MSLTPGTRLGPYEISAPIGVGGMGEVYRATDTILGRQVAIKVLRESVAVDADRLARFDREARTLASLNHPNIAAIYGVERVDGQTALVMELVEGPTLADRLAEGRIPVDEALTIARQIAEALEAAHEERIVHRDLKPANVKVRSNGIVKVLDFGLAKSVEPAAALSPGVSASPTITSPAMTQAGVILGTAAYMSPEQARGKSVDKRADVWAFGCVLYEMLTGRRAFGGDEVTDTLAFVITKEPDWNALPPDTPSSVRRLLRRCLEKDAGNRIHDVADARLELHDTSAAPEADAASPRPIGLWRRAAPWAVALVTAGVAAFVIWRTPGSAPERRGIVHFVLSVPEIRLPPPGGIVLSRDGSRVAYVAGPRSQIYVRSLNEVEPTLLSDTAAASWLSFAPDGQSISYVNPRELRRVGVDGSRSVRLADVATEVSPPVQHWRTDNTILFTSKGVLLRVPADGGMPERVGPADGAPYMLPQIRLDGDTVYVVSLRKGAAELNLRSGTLTTLQGKRRLVSARDCMPDYIPRERGAHTGFVICYDAQARAILAAPFDESRLEGRGELTKVIEGVQPIIGPFGAFDISESGTLAYIEGASRGIRPSTLVWVDRSGKETALPGQERGIESVAVSPNGQRIAMQVYEGGPSAPQRDIWVYDVARETTDRLTVEGRSQGTVWMRDSSRIVHAIDLGRDGRRELRTVSADGGTTAKLSDTIRRWSPTSISSDGKSIIGVGNPGDALQSLMSVVHVGGIPAGPQPFLDLPQFSESGAQFSPSGQFVAYASDKTGANEIYVAAYPPNGREWRVSTDGGAAPRWSANGRELFYRSGKRMIAVKVNTSAEFTWSVPEVLFERDAFGGPDEPYDVAPDGRRFIMLKTVGDAARPRELHVIVNWIEELKRLVPAN